MFNYYSSMSKKEGIQLIQTKKKTRNPVCPDEDQNGNQAKPMGGLCDEGL